jgi:flagellar hook protein FlgE
VTVYDQLGKPYQLTLVFTNEGEGNWSWTASSDDATMATSAGTVAFNPDGTLASFTYPDGGDKLVVTPDRGEAFSIEILTGDAGGPSDLTGYAGTSTAAVKSQDGYQAGELVNIRIDPDGVINGLYSNGASRVLAQIALAMFPNPSGLLRAGGNLYEESSSSGAATTGLSGDMTGSTMISGALESSNVDISEEFTNMIVTQRGFQANARVITAADDMLAEVVNLRR